METIRKIQELAADSKTNIGDLLRQCRILAFRTAMSDFDAWADHELNGYREAKDLPDYRRGGCHAHGNFVGAYEQRNDVPIPPGMLKPEHRHWAETVNLKEPVTVYVDLLSNPERHQFVFQWPANLMVIYQSTFFEGELALTNAWQSVSRGQLLAVVETVRNRVLKFALELERTFPAMNESEKSLPAIERETASQMFQTIIYGNVGNVAAGGTNFRQFQEVSVGDSFSLMKALSELGLATTDIQDLQTALKKDEGHSPGKIGTNASKWIGGLCEKAAGGVGQIAIATAGTVVPKLIAQYLGLPPG